MSQRIFLDRRCKSDRRQNTEQRQNPRLDLPHRRRRRGDDRRVRKSRFQDFLAAREGNNDDFNGLGRKH